MVDLIYFENTYFDAASIPCKYRDNESPVMCGIKYSIHCICCTKTCGIREEEIAEGHHVCLCNIGKHLHIYYCI